MELYRLKVLVNHADWSNLEKYFSEFKETKLKELINTTDIDKLRQLQGQVKLLNELIALRDSVNVSKSL